MSRVFLVVSPRAGLLGVHFNERRAERHAKAVDGVVAEAHITMDYRTDEERRDAR